jgi:hypothetical protein
VRRHPLNEDCGQQWEKSWGTSPAQNFSLHQPTTLERKDIPMATKSKELITDCEVVRSAYGTVQGYRIKFASEIFSIDTDPNRALVCARLTEVEARELFECLYCALPEAVTSDAIKKCS